MKQLLTKTLALVIFACGITAFVLYQSGYFTAQYASTYQGSHNGGALTQQQQDSLYQHKRDSVKRVIWVSTKTVIASDEEMERIINRRLGVDTVQTVPEIDMMELRAASSKVIIMRPKEKISDPPLQDTDTTKTFHFKKQ